MSLTLDNLCLKWGDFQQNTAISYIEYRKDPNFSDVTLVSEEGLKIEAHRIILTASSSFFSNLLNMNEQIHPMIYMRGLKTHDLVAIIDFIYHGEASVSPDDLDRFCTIAQELQLKGLIKSEKYQHADADGNIKTNPTQNKNVDIPYTSGHVEDVLSDEMSIDLTKAHITKNYNVPLTPKKESNNLTVSEDENNLLTNDKSSLSMAPIKNKTNLKSPSKVARIILATDTNKKELKAIINSMIVDHNNGTLSCEICGKVKEMKDGKMPFARLDMSRHIETHIDGISFPCHHCGKISKNRRTHKLHMLNVHSKHRYTCPHCKKSVATLSKLQVHMRVHTGEKPYACPECDRTFAQSSNLYAHQATHQIKHVLSETYKC